MAYEKQKVVELSDAIVAMFDALRDGLQLDQDSDEIVRLVQAVVAAGPSVQQDTDAALLHLVGRLADSVGDRRVGP